MDEKLEDKIRAALKQGTDNSVNLDEKVWQAIKDEIQPNIRGVSRMDNKNRNRNRRRKKLPALLGAGTIAAALLITFFTGTQPGKAAIDKIKELFEPQKQIVEEIEGMPEENQVELKESKMGYILYIDEERYYMEQKDGVDRIIAKHQGENLPEVFMEITQNQDKSPTALAEEIKGELASQFEIFNDIGEVSEPLKGIFFYALSGREWNDTVVRYYLVDNTKGGTFIIKQQFFLEAEEGHGVRLDNILKEFRIVEVEGE